MANVKPGDRAIIVKARCPENIGRIVLVIEPFDKDTRAGDINFVRGLFPRNETMWIVESLGSPLRTDKTTTAFHGNGRVEITQTPVLRGLAIVMDCQLRRLDPPEDEQTTNGVPVKDSGTVVEGVQS